VDDAPDLAGKYDGEFNSQGSDEQASEGCSQASVGPSASQEGVDTDMEEVQGGDTDMEEAAADDSQATEDAVPHTLVISGVAGSKSEHNQRAAGVETEGQ
jgi:hypothetical protein